MPALAWDNPDDRIFESGLDRGVLYLPDGSAVPWNGLTSIVEQFDRETNPVYYDGMKVHDLVVLGDFSATLKAVTYPEEFTEVEGVAEVAPGMYVTDQVPQMFGLSYRNKVGNGSSGDDIGYKIHVLYNLTAIPSDKTYATLSDQPSLVEFEWTITAVPEEIQGYRPTAHLILDSKQFDPLFLDDLEAMLYGTDTTDPELLEMPDMMTFVESWYRVKIIDNGDGSWTALADRDGFIFFLPDDTFKLTGVNAIYLDAGTYEIATTSNLSEVPQIAIAYFPDGSWTATTDQDNLISVVGDEIQIVDANALFIDEGTYVISDTTAAD
jgi:hypothetical protein